MNLLDLLAGPWAILPEKLIEIQAIYHAHLRGEKVDFAAVETRLGRPLANEQRTYEVRDGGVAVQPFMGVMAPRANLLTQVSGGSSTQMLTQQIHSMRADSKVRAVVLQIDSPGGNVQGVPALVDAIRALSAEKPTVAVVEGTMASAAYWSGSAANAVYMEGPTEQVGSLGVYARLSWNAKSDTSMEMVRGKYKRWSINGEKPAPEVIAHAEAQLDHLYGVLIDAVATHRGVTAGQVIDRMAEGRVFIGRQAIDAGLADGFSTLDAMVEQLAADPRPFASRHGGKRSMQSTHSAVSQENSGLSPRGELRTRQAIAEAVQAHATAKGIDVIEAMRQLQLEQAYLEAGQRELHARKASHAQQAELRAALHTEAETYSLRHGVSYLEALKAIDFDARMGA